MGDKQEPNEPHMVQMGTLYVKNKPFRIYEGLNVIGRNTTAAVNIKDIQISKNHAMIAVINANQHFIADFNSANGTKLTSNQLIPLKLYPLDDNVSVQFAEISALYRIDCQEGDAQASDDNTQTSQLTQDLYLKSTQLLVKKDSKQVHFDDDQDSESTTGNPDDENTCDPSYDTSSFHNATTQVMSSDALPSNFHDAATQMMSNEALPKTEATFSKCEDNFHEAETQVLDFPLLSSSRHNATGISSEPTDSSSSKLEIAQHNEQVAGRLHSPESPETSGHKDSNSVPTIDSDSDGSMIFEIRPEDRQHYASIMKRKKSNILRSDDEDDAEPNKEDPTSCSYDDIQTPAFIQQKNARKVESDSETYYDGSNHCSADDCEDVDNETNIIPSTQEDLSEIFNYKTVSPKPGPSNNHTFESSEDSFRLGLTQLMNKADLSESSSNNKNSTLKNTTLNELTSIDHSFTDNLAGPMEENQKTNENHVKVENDSNVEMQTQNISIITDTKDDVQLVNAESKFDDIYAQPTQKFTTGLNEVSTSGKLIQNAQILEDDDNDIPKLPNTIADTESEICVENSQGAKEKQHAAIDDIYILPTQKLVVSNERNEILDDSSDEGQMPSKTPIYGDANNIGCPSVDIESENIIENTECTDRVDADDIYAQPTQKFHVSNINVLSKNSFEAVRYNDENKEITKGQQDKQNKLNSIFDAETELLPQNKPTPNLNINDKPRVSFEDSKIDIDTPVCKKSLHSEQTDHNHIYSMATQVITYPEPLDVTENKDVAAINLETQTEVSFSQENLEPTRVLEERPTNPLVAVLKSDTQEHDEHVENCKEIETEMNNKPVDDSEITKDVSETGNDRLDVKKSKHDAGSGKIKMIGENCLPMQVVPTGNDSCDVIKEDSNIKSKDKKSKRQATSNEEDIERAKIGVVTTRKTRHASLLSNSESGKKTPVTRNNITTETLDQTESKNDSKETARLPKKRGILNSVPEENDEDTSGEGSVMLKRSKRKVLSNIDEIQQEPVAAAAKTAPEETSHLARKKSRRSSRCSNSNEVQLTSKPTKKTSRIVLSGPKTNQSNQDSSSDEFENPSKTSTNLTLKQDNIGPACDSKSSAKEEKIIKSKKSPSRTRKTLDVLNKNKDKNNETGETSNCDKKQKPPLEELLSTESRSRTSSPASTRSDFSLPEAQVHNTRKRPQRLPSAKSPTRSSTPLAEDVTRTPEVQVTRRKRKQEVSKTAASSTSSTSIVEDTSVSEVQTPVRKGRQKSSSTRLSSTNSPLLSNDRLASIAEAHLPSKKRRQNIVDIENSSTSSSENIRSSSANLSALNTPERKKRTLKPKVVFTMMDSPLLESTIRHLGGSVVDSVAACTVLVTEKIKRTMKLLTAIGFAKPICSPKWIQESKKARQFLDPFDFILKDPEAEGKWNFSLSDSLEKSTNRKLMDGLNFHILATDNIADVLKSAIEACGGKCLHRITKNDASKNIFIVTPAECKTKCSKLKKQHQNTTAIDPEAIFESVLRQELTLENHLIDV